MLECKVHRSGSLAVERLVGPKEIVEEQQESKSLHEHGLDEWSTNVASKAFFQCSPEALDDRDGARASDGAETMLDTQATQRGRESLGRELRTFV